MSNYFCAGDLLLPQNCDIQKWAVIACDQFTSDPSYWSSIRDEVGDSPSALHLIVPEAELHTAGEDRTGKICNTMDSYLSDGVFNEYKNAYIYIERTLIDGSVRQGVVGVVDLDSYDYEPNENTKIFATEQTVLQRVPPRVAVRKQAPLEFSHVVMFCDDNKKALIEPIGLRKEDLPLLYDLDLLAGGGHLSGWLLSGDDARMFEKAVANYEKNNNYLIGDGNHSLVTAKLCYESFKQTHPKEMWETTPARYAMVELENIHSDAMSFEPIYRVMTCEDPDKLIFDLQRQHTPDGAAVTWIAGDRTGIVNIPVEEGRLPIESLQRFLDSWMKDNPAQIDYIHGEQATRNLAKQPANVGLLVPELGKQILFPYVLSGKVMPRKTFSIGHAEEKRYYMEGRKIK